MNFLLAKNGEQACEGQDFTEKQCADVGCCQWDGEENECHSNVGTDECVKRKCCMFTMIISKKSKSTLYPFPQCHAKFLKCK